MEEPDHTCDICIVCAMYEEAEAVLDEFSARCGVSFKSAFSQMGRYAYRHATIRNRREERLKVMVTWPADRGPVQTGLDLSLILQEFRPRFAAMAGICAGDRKKVKLGDLIIAECAYLYEEGKVISGPGGQQVHLLETKTAASTSQVIQYAKGFDGWKEPLRAMKRARLKRELKPSEEPQRFIVPMASGMAVRSDNPFPWLRERFHRNTIALDMEAATFYRAFGAASHVHALVVKGVSDYGDGSKNDAYHEYAARASAVYLLTFIQEYVTQESMPRWETSSTARRAGPAGVWNVPHLRNPHFTGRDELLDRLQQQLTPAGGPHAPATTRRAALTQPQAIKGLGGIGKTQIAVEYAYRSRDQGRYTHTLWINAATAEAMLASLTQLAQLLPSFPEKDEADEHKLVAAFKRWLERCEQPWLLIFDNADDLSLVHRYLPQRGIGSILLTTRVSAVGSFATPIEVGNMGALEGAQLLLRRALRFEHASDAAINEATNLVIALDFFPLALDQAGAYIEETGCDLVDYLQLYQTHRKDLLARRGTQATNYPDSVATTWSLSFQKIEQQSPSAAELLRLCAYLAPDNIPEELIREGAQYWSPLLQRAAADLFAFNQMIELLLKFSFVQRLAQTRMLSIHRLVQAVQIDAMEPEVQHCWAERVVRAVNFVFPPGAEPETWSQCLLYLPQAQACVSLIERYTLVEPEAAALLLETARYLSSCALDAQALPLFQQSLAIQQSLTVGERDVSKMIDTLIDLGSVSSAVGRGEQATMYYERAVEMSEQTFGPEHPRAAQSLYHLALHWGGMGEYTLEESLLERALAGLEKASGPEHPDVAAILDSLGLLYYYLDDSERAEPLLERALAIREKAFGPDDIEIGASLHNLAILYRWQRKYEQAEPLLERALAIRESVLSAGHPAVLEIISELVSLYDRQRNFEQAVLLLQRYLPICEKMLGPEHPTTRRLLGQLASAYYEQKEYEQAEALLLRVQAIEEKTLVPEHAERVTTLSSLARLYRAQGKYAQAEVLYQRVLAMREKAYIADSDETVTIVFWSTMCDLAELYRAQGKHEQIRRLHEHALALYGQQSGRDQPQARTLRKHYARFLRAVGHEEEASKLEDSP
jgi:tetratricopeptide (TPR) repeat protein/nucleoside phosphorylase